VCPAPLVCDPATSTCELTPSVVDAAVPDPDATVLPDFAELSGQQWLMPCAAAPNPTLCDCADSALNVQVGGTIGVTYAVTVRIRGVMERGDYANGTSQDMWYVGGDNASAILTVAGLDVSAPAEHYFVNEIASGGGLHFLDYEATLPIEGGATVTLFMSATDAREIADATTAVIPGVTTTPSPYLGQFAQIDVVAVTLP